MNKTVTLEDIEWQFVDAAEHACSQNAYALLRAELEVFSDFCFENPSIDNLIALTEMRDRVVQAHRNLFRLVS